MSPPLSGAVPLNDGRISLARCRELLGAEYAAMPEEELRALRDRLYALADVALEAAEENRRPKAEVGAA